MSRLFNNNPDYHLWIGGYVTHIFVSPHVEVIVRQLTSRSESIMDVINKYGYSHFASLQQEIVIRESLSNPFLLYAYWENFATVSLHRPPDTLVHFFVLTKSEMDKIQQATQNGDDSVLLDWIEIKLL